MNNRLQLISKFFSAITFRLSIKHLRATAYHEQTHDQVEYINRDIV